MTEFRLPKGVTGFNVDDTPTAASVRSETFTSWCRALGDAMGSRTTAVPTEGNFDVISLDSHQLWLLHNRYVPLIGAVDTEPNAGFAYAVEGEFVDIGADPPSYLASWGPTLLPAATLNRELTVDDWASFSPPARDHADQFKPTRVSHLVFNYWDERPAPRR